MNNKDIISSKILSENHQKSQENSCNFSPFLHKSHDLIITPNNSFKKPPFFVNNRNIPMIRFFNKTMINSSAPSLLTFSQKATISSSILEERMEKFCKICFEKTENLSIGKLISPCKCSGSMMFIHENCLKTWLISQNNDLKTAICELCHHYYQMDFKFKLKFYPEEALKSGISNTLALICFVIFFVCLIVIIIIFIFQMEQVKSDDDKGISSYHKIGIISSCSFVALIVLFLIYLTSKEVCFVKYLKDWTIHEPKKHQEKAIKAKIDKKKIAPKPVFRIKPPFIETTDIKKKILRFFAEKAFSDSNLLRNHQGFYVKSTILRISSKKKLVFSDENKKKLFKKNSSVIYCRKEIKNVKNFVDFDEIRDLKRLFSNVMPKEFLSDEKEDEKTIDVLIEMKEKP